VEIETANRDSGLQDIASTSDLPPAPPDGRESWQQAFWELSPFVFAALLLIISHISAIRRGHAGWQRDAEFLGKVIMPLTLPFLLLGLARGLPRWAYPFGGMLLGYQIFVSYQSSMWLFLFVMLLAFRCFGIRGDHHQPATFPPASSASAYWAESVPGLDTSVLRFVWGDAIGHYPGFRRCPRQQPDAVSCLSALMMVSAR
jgi:hypothetical protein